MTVVSRDSLRTVGALVGLTATLPVDLVLVGAALATRRFRHPPVVERVSATDRKTVLISGGKMTKALQLARSFHAAGHRVVLVESGKYRWTGHRFSRAVDAFHCVPEATAPGYADAVAAVARLEDADVFVPVSSPAGSAADADAGAVLAGVCDTVHADPATVRTLDDKAAFSRTAESFGLRVPDFVLITDAAQVETFDFPPDRTYILKRIAYNPVGRMDLTPLRATTPEHNRAVARARDISPDDPWILQEFIDGTEFCTHGTVRDGRLQVYGCCESSAFQINYAMIDKPEIRSWVEHFVSGLQVTGQLSFDFIESADGTVYAIECNPRTHSAITMFYDHPDVAAAYLQTGHPVIEPRPTARATYWIYHELWRLLTQHNRRARLSTIVRGTDAIFTWDDPLPYLMVHHLQIPSLLIRSLRSGRGWSRIDFNIGKLVETGGD
ncbi:ATP-grasp domain-containing protein [Williamsia sterculiae]|uniref:Carbamoylphosphate synthase large subunit n=1 Tax=Williamsia sterculiae TaxID=1344003 RepID=A0A1N7H5D0_9NOCA|nr:ATP-grasp enzyme [Williamsia sterculiae]SIS20065.1 Carbamoylphosphate synthase large subunit [Williamsia sterculiae]